jgi:hypothetical protein
MGAVQGGRLDCSIGLLTPEASASRSSTSEAAQTQDLKSELDSWLLVLGLIGPKEDHDGLVVRRR